MRSSFFLSPWFLLCYSNVFSFLIISVLFVLNLNLCYNTYCNKELIMESSLFKISMPADPVFDQENNKGFNQDADEEKELDLKIQSLISNGVLYLVSLLSKFKKFNDFYLLRTFLIAYLKKQIIKYVVQTLNQKY